MLQKRSGKATLVQLRELLQQRFPRSQPAVLASLPTGIPEIDDPLGGGLPRGAISEVVEARVGSGGQLVLIALLEAVRRLHRFVALVDAMDGFDPQTVEPFLLRHLLWVRGNGVTPALQAADLLARYLPFLRQLVERRLRDLQIVGELANSQHGSAHRAHRSSSLIRWASPQLADSKSAR